MITLLIVKIRQGVPRVNHCESGLSVECLRDVYLLLLLLLVLVEVEVSEGMVHWGQGGLLVGRGVRDQSLERLLLEARIVRVVQFLIGRSLATLEVNYKLTLGSQCGLILHYLSLKYCLFLKHSS
jgi:hypothetical protein